MIHIENEDFLHVNAYIASKNPSKILLLCDENTHEHVIPLFLSSLKTDVQFEIIEIEPGEELKNIDSAVSLWEILTEFEVDRKALVINVGGGVICDLGGFVASTYKRGISFIHVPTTLLSMVDASIGGKTGIDHGYLKNIIGTFAMPEGIFVYPSFLNTLPQRELQSGFAEMLKHGLIASKKHYSDLKNMQELSVEKVSSYIVDSMKIKNDIVEQDFKEAAERKKLNYGHTMGHAIESALLARETPITHGQAVALGMVLENILSYNLGLLNKEEMEEINNTIFHFFPALDIKELENSVLLSFMQHDKKNENGSINFSLISEVGTCLINQKASIEEINKVLNTYKGMF